MQYTFVTKILPVDFEGTLYNSEVKVGCVAQPNNHQN